MLERPEPDIYQPRVVLLGISPIIWRRLLVRNDSTIADLHHTLQITFGWSDDHLHRFLIYGRQYGVAYITHENDSHNFLHFANLALLLYIKHFQDRLNPYLTGHLLNRFGEYRFDVNRQPP